MIASGILAAIGFVVLIYGWIKVDSTHHCKPTRKVRTHRLLGICAMFIGALLVIQSGRMLY